MRPAPVREPGFEDEPAPPHLRLVHSVSGRSPGAPELGPSALTPQLPFPKSTADSAHPHLRLVPDLRPTDVAALARPDADHEPQLRRPRLDPSRFGRQFAQGVVEVLSGRRPVVQLARHVSPSVQRGLARATGPAPLQNAVAPTLHSLHLSEPAEGVCELSAVVAVGARYRALAARLEWTHDQWRCTALQVG